MVGAFARACRLLAKGLAARPVIVACSGGADSGAALLLARRAAPGARLIACYVDHGMRPGASIQRDLAAVRSQARAAKAEVVTRRMQPTSIPRGSPEERLRIARYRELEAVARDRGAAFVITGHQRDDLIESALLALTRGSGVDGIAAMRPRRALSDRVDVVRPLLWATKAQCLALVRELNVPFSTDETNGDTRLPRNAVRALLAALEQALPTASRGIARSIALVSDDRVLLDGIAAQAVRAATQPGSSDLRTRPLRALPPTLVRRIVRHTLRQRGYGIRNFSFAHCNAIAQAIAHGRGGRYHAGEVTVVLSAGRLVVEAAVRRSGNTAPVPIRIGKLPHDVVTPWGRATLSHVREPTGDRAPSVTLLDMVTLHDAGDLEVRAAQRGDACIPTGRRRPVSLARFLGKNGVPSSRRGQAAVLCAGGRIAAVLGLRAMEPFGAKPGKPALAVRWQATDI
jgi:tRNA(Ile)-lysidine synthase